MTMDKWFYGKFLSISNTASQRCHYMGKPRRTKVRTTNMEHYEVVLEWYPVHATCWTEFKDQGLFWKGGVFLERAGAEFRTFLNRQEYKYQQRKVYVGCTIKCKP